MKAASEERLISSFNDVEVSTVFLQCIYSTSTVHPIQPGRGQRENNVVVKAVVGYYLLMSLF